MRGTSFENQDSPPATTAGLAPHAAASASDDHQGTSPTPEEMKTNKETCAFNEKYGTTHADRLLAYD